jgi:hypothetical protein
MSRSAGERAVVLKHWFAFLGRGLLGIRGDARA